MTEEYDYFEFLRDQIAEIDIYGAEDFFGSKKNKSIEVLAVPGHYDF